MDNACGRWRVEPVTTDEPAALVAASAAAFDALAAEAVPTVRWYRASGEAVVLGRAQASRQLAPAGVAVCIRGTGGGAVWLSPDMLSCDVLAPADHPLVAGEPLAAFDRVGRAWRDGLADLGVAGLDVHTGASTARPRGDARERLLAEVCFASRARGEVLHAGRKLVGLAQRRRRHGVMVQCGLLRRWRPERLLRALDADPHHVDVAAAAVGLDDLPDQPAPPPTEEDVVRAVSARLAGDAPAVTTSEPARRRR